MALKNFQKYFIFALTIPLFLHVLLGVDGAKVVCQEKYYFFRGYSYGSDAVFNPLMLIANGGFDELQPYGMSHNLADIPWKLGATGVWRDITAPLWVINQYGWNKFLRQEIIPSSLNTKYAQYFPNYALHLLGGGMDSRKVAEWYDYYHFPCPTLLSAITAMSYHYINEIIENGAGTGPNEDPIPDLLIFDPLGILLFSFDGVSEFFSTTLHFNDWSSQPAFSFAPLGLRNTGQNFVMKYALTSSGRTSLFYHFGAFGILGLSIKTNNEDAISFGGGVCSKYVFIVDITNGIPTQSIEVCPVAGVYWDRNNSLLAALVVSPGFNDMMRLNIYPGVIWIGNVSPGLFCSIGEHGIFTAGFTVSFLPLGLSGFHPG